MTHYTSDLAQLRPYELTDQLIFGALQQAPSWQASCECSRSNDMTQTEVFPHAVQSNPLSPDEVHRLDAYWREANYLSVGQIYLLSNPLLKTPLMLDQIKPRLLGHWGTTPGLNFIYAHFNRAIKKYDLNAIYIAGPGHGGPGVVANVYLEGTYSERYPNIPQTEAGMQK